MSSDFPTNGSEKRERLKRFSRALFCLNSDQAIRNNSCNSNIETCPFIHDGPHRKVCLGLGATTIILSHVEHGFDVVQKPVAQRLQCCSAIVCRKCGVELYDTHIMLLVLCSRNEILCQVLQRYNQKLTKSGPVPLVSLMRHSDNMFSLIRDHVDRLLFKAHRASCTNRITFLSEMIDPLTVNRIINGALRDRCETCLYAAVENDVYLEITHNEFLRNIVVNGGDGGNGGTSRQIPTIAAADDANGSDGNDRNDRNGDDPNGYDDQRVNVLCRCCLMERAQINVPCGHVFQCRACKATLKEALLTRGDTFNLLHDPPCSVCRAPVFMTMNIYD